MIALRVFLLLAVATAHVSSYCMSTTTLNYMGYITNYMKYVTGKSYLPKCTSSRYKTDAYYAVYYGNLFKQRIKRLMASYYGYKWVKYNGHCYTFGRYTTLPWTDARALCLSMGADLVTIDSSSENYWLKQKMGRYASWTGLSTTSGRKNNLRWTKTNRSPSYTSFKSRYSNVCPRKCVYVSYQYWYVTSCTSNLYFICEKNKC